MSVPGRNMTGRERGCDQGMVFALLLVATLVDPPPSGVPWSRVRSLEGASVREVRVWHHAPGEATVETLRDGERIELRTVEMDVPPTPQAILLREADAVELECLRTVSPGWPAARVRNWSRPPDAALADGELARALPDWQGGGALIWYFDDMIVIARTQDGRVIEIHEVFEPGTVELRRDAARARSDLDRSLQRIRSRNRN